jgi:CRISPR/Cas system-associated exonuclease Cas4 (RecB family)
MPLVKDFIFSAKNLQDYMDCPRRFELKYILKQSWPAITSQPVQAIEYKIQMGSRFHQLAHQYLSGIPGNLLKTFIGDPDLIFWFGKFQEHIQPNLIFPYFSEFTITMPFEGFRLIAIFDFITLVGDKKIVIKDWKTTTRIPKRELYLQSIQTFLYPLMVFETRSHIFPSVDFLQQEDISMEYWFPAFPEKTITLEYSRINYDTSHEILSSLINEIAIKAPGTFTKTTNDKRCAFCQYRSLCERGIQAGKFEEDDEPADEAVKDYLDFDQIDEIAF